MPEGNHGITSGFRRSAGFALSNSSCRLIAPRLPMPTRRPLRLQSSACFRVCEIVGCWVYSASMSTCPSCQHPATKRDGYDAAGRQRYYCRPCRRDFTAHSTSAFSRYRWPPDVILMTVRWYCSLPLSAHQVVGLLAERHIDVTARTVLNWVQTFGPQLAAAIRRYRRRVGRKWTVDEVFCFRGK